MTIIEELKDLIPAGTVSVSPNVGGGAKVVVDFDTYGEAERLMDLLMDVVKEAWHADTQ